ncbi:MAG: transcriptional activator RfaH [Rhizomicrobium sp.]
MLHDVAAQRKAAGTVVPGLALDIDGAVEGSTGERWYVVHTQPHAEGRAISNLERQGYGIFCPRTYKTVRHARKATRVLAPLFPNYLFVRLDVSRDLWRSVNGTRGVIRLITQGEEPQPVPHGIVEALQSRLSADGTMSWTSSFKIGQAVRISDGPFVDFVGTLEHLDAAGRVRVLLDMLGRSVSVALRCEALAPAA